MLGSEYALKYSMPHSVVHIIDNSMYTGQLPTVIADDPSLYATLVVTGAPMGPDNEIIPINRSDVLNVSYGINNISPSDVKKYGQTITYPASLLAQNTPIKFMRVTPEDSTYAFSCLLVQWKWDGNMMHVRFKTTSGNGNSGLPAGVVHSNFKNTDKLNTALVHGNAMEVRDEIDGSTWTQRTFMTAIAAGRGKTYNNFNYSINLTNQTRRPANTRYLFSTIDTKTSQVVEQFFASLINENNNLRADAIDSVNVVVGQRVKGSSIIIPTINEEAIKELYTEYMLRMKEMIDEDIPPVYGTKDMKFVEDVYKTMSVNIFDPIYGRYIYNGDSDVKLPYFQSDMVDLDLPQLSTANRIKTFLGETETVPGYLANPTDLESVLDTSTYGITNESDPYHVGDVFCNAPTSMTLSMITSINQYSGSVTVIPINRVVTHRANPETGENRGKPDEYDTFRGYAMIKKTSDDNEIAGATAAVQDLVDRKKLVPREYIDDENNKAWKPDYVIIGLNDTNPYNKLNTFMVVKATYTYDATAGKLVAIINNSGEDKAVFKTKADLYGLFAYPDGTVTAFCEDDGGSEYRYIAGTTVINNGDTLKNSRPAIIDATTHKPFSPAPALGEVYVNAYNTVEPKKEPGQDDPGEIMYKVASSKPFVIGSAPTKVVAYSDMVGTAYDNIVYKDDAGVDTIEWRITGGTPAGTPSGYTVGDIVTLIIGEGANALTTYFQIKSTTDNGDNTQTVTIARYKKSGTTTSKVVPGTYATDATKVYTIISAGDGFNPEEHYKWDDVSCTIVAGVREDNPDNFTWYDLVSAPGTGLSIKVDASNINANTSSDPAYIQRFNITGTQGSLFRYQPNNTEIPTNYYSDSYGINPNSELGGIPIENGYAGFFDDNISEIEFKWRYSNLLVQAYRGKLDPRITSPTRCPAKFLFDGGTNTIVGQTILPYMNYAPIDIINASTIYTDDEKEAILLNNKLIENITEFVDVDVKQAMYDLMITRVFQGIPEDKRPIGPGSGLSLHLDSGVTDANTAMLINQSFNKRFNNPNASWDIGGYVSTADGISYTYTKRLVDNMFAHMRRYSVNKPFTGKYSNIGPTEYSSFFPDVDTADWELRELLYNSGGNAWMMDINGNLQRQSQRTLYRENGTSDLIQESNMRTLSQLVYLLQNKINSYLLEYNDDGVLATLKDEVDNMFSNWVGNTVQDLEIIFKRDINPTDGGEIVVCYVNVTFRGLILRVPIIVNVQRRTTSE